MAQRAAAGRPGDTAGSDGPSPDGPSRTGGSDGPSRTAGSDGPSRTGGSDGPSRTGGPDGIEFAERTAPFRRELLAHCYRLLGSVDDAEDLVQETYLRAWRSYDGFEGRSSVRAWLYRIATNACLTALRHGSRRQLPSGLGAPGDDTDPASAGGSEAGRLQPVPDALVTPESGDPATVAVARESLRLALIAGLQYLPPGQRAVLLLRDVLAFPAAEVAEMLGTSTAAVKSSLQRARSRLARVAPTPERISEPAEPEMRALLDRYIAAFERSDAAALERLLRADATLELPPSHGWYTGGDAAAHAVAGLGSPGDWRMVATAANGQPAAAAYRRGDDGAHHAYGIVVLTAAGTGIARITVFADPALFTAFGLPPVHRTDIS
ncbi:RNA polymerase sigma factor [Streptomyces albiflavescens]|uniref:RNA polymerase sigma factor n=1 Tax=Streptomyces albiflavescens TaxID=1623582 RepID=A0A917Y9I1_9ACTN|nr:sigma-70 family RNA polymerase sigma factor [Streptomyces albiflavescens]GGN77812.1 RNA polymerase sigma factor [Streptomyces albiflavescens]